jgi:hypothetical protein
MVTTPAKVTTSPRAAEEPECAVVDCVTVVYSVGALFVAQPVGEPLAHVSKPPFGTCANVVSAQRTIMMQRLRINLFKVLLLGNGERVCDRQSVCLRLEMRINFGSKY